VADVVIPDRADQDDVVGGPVDTRVAPDDRLRVPVEGRDQRRVVGVELGEVGGGGECDHESADRAPGFEAEVSSVPPGWTPARLTRGA
jgi:hypothetical protein